MKKIIKYIVVILCFSAIFIVLQGKVNLPIFISGCVIALIGLFISDSFLLSDKYASLFNFNVFLFLTYFFYLLYKIIVSGVKAAIMTVSKDTSLTFFYFQSNLNDDFKLNLLANSITLTPGTVTVNREGNILFVMQLCMNDNAHSDFDIRKFESKLKKI